MIIISGLSHNRQESNFRGGASYEILITKTNIYLDDDESYAIESGFSIRKQINFEFTLTLTLNLKGQMPTTNKAIRYRTTAKTKASPTNSLFTR